MSQQDEKQDQSFNDAELQDIMNEIESLEREFVEEETDITAEVDTDDTPVGDAFDEEVETQTVEASADDSDDEDAESLVNEVADDYESNVVSIQEHRAPSVGSTVSAASGQMQFSGMGNMDFNLNFPIGESTAEVQVKDGKLLVTLEGVELTLSEEGCEVTMEGGVKFTVPVTAKTTGKKAA